MRPTVAPVSVSRIAAGKQPTGLQVRDFYADAGKPEREYTRLRENGIARNAATGESGCRSTGSAGRAAGGARGPLRAPETVREDTAKRRERVWSRRRPGASPRRRPSRPASRREPDCGPGGKSRDLNPHRHLAAAPGLGCSRAFSPVSWRRPPKPSYACLRLNATKRPVVRVTDALPGIPDSGAGDGTRRLPQAGGRRCLQLPASRTRNPSVSAGGGTDGLRSTGPTAAGSWQPARSRWGRAGRGPREPSLRPGRNGPPRRGPPRAC